MTKTFSAKKAAALILAVCMLVSVLGAFGCVTASADTHYATLYYTDWNFSKYGMSGKSIYIKTDGAASEQQVIVHHNYLPYEDWIDTEAEYVTTLDDGSKLWKADVTSYMHNYDKDFEFVIKYVADGVTYWNNNNGSNYINNAFGVAPIAVQRYGSDLYIGNTITVTLQNYAYNKNVFIRYTNDNWNTYTDAPMSYNKTNADGTENWTGEVSVTASDYSDFEYCVCYQVNGNEYWANNFGENYGYHYRIRP